MNNRKLNKLADSAVKEKQRNQRSKVSGILTGALLGSTLYFANSTQVHADTVSGNAATVKNDTFYKEETDKFDTGSGVTDIEKSSAMSYTETGVQDTSNNSGFDLEEGAKDSNSSTIIQKNHHLTNEEKDSIKSDVAPENNQSENKETAVTSTSPKNNDGNSKTDPSPAAITDGSFTADSTKNPTEQGKQQTDTDELVTNGVTIQDTDNNKEVHSVFNGDAELKAKDNKENDTATNGDALEDSSHSVQTFSTKKSRNSSMNLQMLSTSLASSTLADKYTPKGTNITVINGQSFNPSSLISNYSDLPAGTSVTASDIDTTITGRHQTTVTIKYSDGSIDTADSVVWITPTGMDTVAKEFHLDINPDNDRYDITVGINDNILSPYQQSNGSLTGGGTLSAHSVKKGNKIY